MIFGVWNNWENIGVGDAFLIALIAIFIVFLVLIIIILITSLFQKGIEKVTAMTNILPKEDNKILSDDKDAVVAMLVATIDFHRETGKEPRVVSIKRIED